MGFIKKFQCQLCQGIVETEFDDDYVICGHCESACQVPKEFGPGVVIDDFVVAKLLGQGGMGDVYLAHQFSLDRKVALKILKDDFMKDPKFKDEFIYEARNVACLNHPNIIQAYKVGEEDGVVFFAMEYVEGRNLQDILKEDGAITEKLALSVAMEIVAALGYAWKLRKLVHRDIKPENIMMTNDGVAKLMDLGLSLRDGDNKDEGDMIAGTPQYISPEQILGADMDIRGDFYCLGATLYHLVSGKMPFEGNLQQIVKSHLSEKPKSLRKVVPGIDDFFAKIIHKMMSKKPENRYASAEELLTAFRKDMKLIEDGEHGKKHFKVNTQTNIKTATQTSEITRRKKKKDPLILASIIMLSLIIGGFLIIKMSMGKTESPMNTKSLPKSSKVISNAVSKTPSANRVVELNKGLYYRYFHSDSKNIDDIEKGELISQGITQTVFSGPPDKHSKGYGLIYDGVIKIEHSETYQFSLQVDNACRITIDNKKLFDIEENDGEKNVTRTLSKGFHPIKIEYRNGSGAHNLDFRVESVSYNKMKVANDWFYLNQNANKDLSIDENKTGLNYSLYKETRFIRDAFIQLPDSTGKYRKISPDSRDVSIKENYVIEYDTVLKLPKAGVYTFYLTATPKAELHINGNPVLYDQASTDGASLVTLNLSQLNCLKILYQDSKEHKKLTLEVEGEGLERQQIPTGWYYQNINEELLSEQKEKKKDKVRYGGVGKISYSYYEGINNFQEVKQKQALKKGILPNITNVKMGKSNKYGYLFSGSINIPEDGDYIFYLDADSEAWFGIEEQSVWSGGKPNNKRFILTKGRHSYSLTYLQKGGSSRLSLKVKSQSFPVMDVPSSWFSTGAPTKSTLNTASASRTKEPKVKGQLRYNYYEVKLKEDVAGLITQPVKSSGIEPDLNAKKGKRSEHYGLYYYGYLNIPKTAEYLFHIKADDRGLLKIGDSELLRSTGGKDANSAKRHLKAGKHKFEFFYYQNTHGASILVQVEADGLSKRRIPSSWFSIDDSNTKSLTKGFANSIKPEALEVDDSFEPGLKYTLYKSAAEVEDMDQVLKSRIKEKDVDCRYFKCDEHSAGANNNYGLVYEGYFYSNVDQTQTFGLTSNDGSRLYLGGQLVIDNDGVHKATEKNATVMIKKGLYKFRLEYFQQLMSRELTFTWKNKAGKMVPVQERVFYRKKDTKTADIEPGAAIDRKVFENGLKYSLYKSSKPLKNIDQMLKSKLVKKDETTDVVDIVKDAGQYKNDYGLVYEGFIKVDRDGDQTFSVMSNDDTRLYLEDKLIIDNDQGRKSDVAKIKKVNLKKGMYKIRIVYYQDDGQRDLDLRWKNESGKMVHVHGHKLFIKK